ncbi:mitofusin, partial [Ceratobasidium sp. 423]
GFIVIAVNHYDRIRDKARCNRRILEQIKDISPHTYDNRDELIHFIDSKSALATSLIAGAEEQGLVDPSFISLESSIRSSVLHNLSKSKLMPAEDYLMMLLSDIKLLATSNAFLAEPGTDGAKSILEKSESIFDGLKAPWEVTRGELGAFEETARVEVDVKRSTEDTANIPNGKLDAGSEPFTWRSILKAWDYTDESIPSPFWV